MRFRCLLAARHANDDDDDDDDEDDEDDEDEEDDEEDEDDEDDDEMLNVQCCGELLQRRQTASRRHEAADRCIPVGFGSVYRPLTAESLSQVEADGSLALSGRQMLAEVHTKPLPDYRSSDRWMMSMAMAIIMMMMMMMSMLAMIAMAMMLDDVDGDDADDVADVAVALGRDRTLATYAL